MHCSTKRHLCVHALLVSLFFGSGVLGALTAHAQTALVQAQGGVDYRYDSSARLYYFDANQNGVHDDGERYVDLNIIDAGSYNTIQEAVNFCLAGSTTKQGCVVRIPKGIYAQNINIGGTTLPTTQYGITLEGVGAGLENNVGNDLCAVTITGNGSANNTIITIDGAVQITLRNFCINGGLMGSAPKYGVQIAPIGSQPTHYVTLQDMTIENISASGGYAVTIGNGTDQADFITLERLILRNDNGCVLNDSQQAVDNISRHVECTRFTGPQAYMIAQGQLRLSDFYIAPSASGQAGIVYEFTATTGPLGAVIESGTFEWPMDNGTFIDFRNSGGTGTRRTNFIKNVRFQPQFQATNRHVCVNWNVRGTLVLIANDFESTTANATCQINLNNTDTSIPSYVYMMGNQVNLNFSENIVINRSTAGGLLSLRRMELNIDQTCLNTSPCTASLGTLRKPADQMNDSTSFVNDDTLQFPVNANAIYSFRMVVFFDTINTAKFKFQLTGPASATLLRVEHHAIAPAATSIGAVGVSAAFSTPTTVSGSGSTGGYVEVNGILQNGVNAGIVALQWAQNTANAGPTVVRAGSYVEVNPN
jgi:hypothetical protein